MSRVGWEERISWAVTVTIFLITFYFIGASVRFRSKHPEFTETQLTLHFWDVVYWR